MCCASAPEQRPPTENRAWRIRRIDAFAVFLEQGELATLQPAKA